MPEGTSGPLTSDSPPHLLWRELEELRRRLAEANETLEAIGSGEVDAVVVRQGAANQVFTLDGAERPYRMFVEEMQQGAVTLGPGGTVLFCNRRFAEMLRCQPAQIAGLPFASHVAPASQEAWRALLQATGSGRAAGELALRRQDGTSLPAFVAVSAMAPTEGASLTVVVADLTEQKHFERLRVVEQELRELLAAAGQASRAKDRFLAVLGHELRNPLGPIRNAVALMKLAGSGDPVVQGARTVIERQVAQMTRLIEDLLDVSRIASGKIILRKEKLDLAELVAAAVADHRPLLEAGGLELKLAAPAGFPAFLDATRIAQVVGNLLLNAGKFTDRGGRVTIRLERGGPGEALITVTDTGIGIDPAGLETLFDPFVQAERSLGRSQGGLGLGLALAKGLVELHGGRIHAHSAGLGQGCEFSFVLPIALGPPGPAAPPVPLEALSGPRTLRILVIEDNVDAAETLRMLLAYAGHAVAVANTGPEGLEKATTFKPEVVLCDIGLTGGMDGHAVAKAIRARPALAPVRLIAMTGFSQDEDRRRAEQAGFDQHLTKPADPEALLLMLARF